MLGRLHPVFKRHDDRVRPDERFRAARSIGDLPRFDREENGVDDVLGIVGGVDALDDEVAIHAVDAQAPRAQGFQRRAARDEEDDVARLSELAAEVTKHRTESDSNRITERQHKQCKRE